jgi:hypothetical protein
MVQKIAGHSVTAARTRSRKNRHDPSAVTLQPGKVLLEILAGNSWVPSSSGTVKQQLR